MFIKLIHFILFILLTYLILFIYFILFIDLLFRLIFIIHLNYYSLTLSKPKKRSSTDHYIIIEMQI